MIASEFDPDARKGRRQNVIPEPQEEEEDEEGEEDTLDGVPVAASALVKQEPSVTTLVKKEIGVDAKGSPHQTQRGQS